MRPLGRPLCRLELFEYLYIAEYGQGLHLAAAGRYKAKHGKYRKAHKQQPHYHVDYYGQHPCVKCNEYCAQYRSGIYGAYFTYGKHKPLVGMEAGERGFLGRKQRYQHQEG